MSRDPDLLRVLVVDDDAVDRMGIARLLSADGLRCEVVECGDGIAGLRELLGARFDAALLDYHLPDADGLEVLRSARAAGVETPVVALSGQRDQRVAVELMKEGAADYLVKDGLDAERLATTLRNVVASHRAERRARSSEQALRTLVEATAPVVGADFFHALARHLATAFGARHALVGELVDDDRMCRALALWSDDGYLPGREYALAAAPCRALPAAAGSVAAADVRLDFCAGLGFLAAGGYRGIALRDHDGKAVGLLAVLADHPIEHDERHEALLTVFAARAAAELERLRAEQALASSLRLEKGMVGFARALLADTQPARTLELALKLLLDAVDATGMSLHENEDDEMEGLRAVCIAATSLDGAAGAVGQRLPYRSGFRRWENDLSSGLPVSGLVRMLPSCEQPALLRAGMRAVMALPYHVHGLWAGYLRIEHQHEHRWLKEEVRLLRGATGLLGTYLERCGRHGSRPGPRALQRAPGGPA
jgi:CheY-like chemotaxis protein